jgi:hypothetical protein
MNGSGRWSTMGWRATLPGLAVCAAALGALAPGAAQAQSPLGFGSPHLQPGNLVVSTSQYREADIQPGVTVLPPGCTTGCATATADGAYSYVFDNDIVDSSFGVAAPIVLDQYTPAGRVRPALLYRDQCLLGQQRSRRDRQ